MDCGKRGVQWEERTLLTDTLISEAVVLVVAVVSGGRWESVLILGETGTYLQGRW